MKFSKIILTCAFAYIFSACGMEKITTTKTDNTLVIDEPTPTVENEKNKSDTSDKNTTGTPSVKHPTSQSFLDGCLNNENIIYRTPAPVFNEKDLLICGIFQNLNISTLNGCWECSGDNVLSVHNETGIYGKNQSADSIRNRASVYGTRTDEGSVCNTSPSRPPRLVQTDGIIKGHLSVSTSFEDSICNESSEFFNLASCTKLKVYCKEL